MIKTRWSISSTAFLLLLSAWFTLALNLPFYRKVYGYLVSLPDSSMLFWCVIPIVVMVTFTFLLSALLIPKIDRFLMAFLVLASAMVSWMELSYGIIFDYTMLDNIFQTNSAEAKTYLSQDSILYVTTLGLAPAVVILFTQIRYAPLKRELAYRFGVMSLALLVFGGAAGGFYKAFADTGRNNRDVHQLLVPNQLVYSIGKYAARSIRGPGEPFRDLTKGSLHEHHHRKPQLMVLVLGETARASSFSVNGYERPTDIYTVQSDFINLGNVTACGTATAVSVPCMFSFIDHDHYDSGRVSNESNLLDVVAASGFDVFWIDNNNGCKGVCQRVQHEQIPTDIDHPMCDGDYCLDEILVSRLDALLAQGIKRDTLVVLHMIGSHGPTYYRRYPEAFRQFLPDCQRSDIQNCSEESIRNTYDNTILYTDWVLAELAKTITERQPELRSNLLYISDHGESLGEHGLFLHGMPWRIAPDEQKEVPELLWMSEAYREDLAVDDACLGRLVDRSFSQDNLPHTVLGLIDVDSPNYRPELDALAPCIGVNEQLSMESNDGLEQAQIGAGK